MIAWLSGLLIRKSPDRALIDVRDIGYDVAISSQTFDQLPREGERIKLLIHHHFTDNDQRLFGFMSRDEKDLFELLITVKGVGPKLALTILSGLAASEIVESIRQSDTAALSRISGIGKKTAERMILELQDKMGTIHSRTPAGSTTGIPATLRDEVLSALMSLGFKKGEAEQAVWAALKEHGEVSGVQELVKAALAWLNK